MLESIDWFAVALAVAVFIFLICVVLILKRYNIIENAAFLTLIAVPIATYGLATGIITEFNFGGFSAELDSALESPPENEATIRIGTEAIQETNLLIEGDESLQVFEKAGIPNLENIQSAFEPGKPLAMTLELGRTGYYSSKAIELYVNSFLSLDPDATVIFTDEDGKFVASSSGQSLLAASHNPNYETSFIPSIESADLDQLKAQITITEKSASFETSKADVLRMMNDDGVGTMVVVDELNNPSGIVSRDKILSDLMLALAEN